MSTKIRIKKERTALIIKKQAFFQNATDFFSQKKRFIVKKEDFVLQI